MFGAAANRKKSEGHYRRREKKKQSPCDKTQRRKPAAREKETVALRQNATPDTGRRNGRCVPGGPLRAFHKCRGYWFRGVRFGWVFPGAGGSRDRCTFRDTMSLAVLDEFAVGAVAVLGRGWVGGTVRAKRAFSGSVRR